MGRGLIYHGKVEFWWFELTVINVVYKFGPVELMVGL
jgi:hypothetical protein